MFLWLPPSEGKIAPTAGPPLQLDTLSFPALTEARALAASELLQVSAGPDAAKVLGLGPRAAEEGIKANLGLFTMPCSPALNVYDGVLYSELDANSLSRKAMQTLTESTWIFSALFGALRPHDSIPDHRLAMGVRLPALGALSAWWRPRLEEYLPATGGAPVVDLRSGVYQSAYPARSAHRVEIRAVQVRKGKRRVLSHFAKLWRGKAARHLLESVPEAGALDDVLSALANWRDSAFADVEIEETQENAVGGSVTRVTLVLHPA